MERLEGFEDNATNAVIRAILILNVDIQLIKP